MKNFYRILELTQQASSKDIKKAYRRLALIYHPDKGGENGSVEKMALISNAYSTLIDPDKRTLYDADWRAYQEADLDTEYDVFVSGHLKAGKAIPYSQSFREQHEALEKQYTENALKEKPENRVEEPFKSGIYSLEEEAEPRIFNDIFTFIREKTSLALKKRQSSLLNLPSESLSPLLAVNVFMDFLAGNHYGLGLVNIKEYFSSQLRTKKSQNEEAPEIPLYEGINDIFLMTEKNEAEQEELILSINKITGFAKQAPDLLLPCITPLFYNKYFRNLYTQALHLYWQSKKMLFDEEQIKKFKGYQEAKDLLNVLKERLSNNNDRNNLTQLTRSVRLLFDFEKDTQRLNIGDHDATEHRKGAFHLLDWIPTFIENSNKEVLVNIFLQIGIKFQQTSRLEFWPELKMADEQLALKMYMTAVEIAHHATADVEIYANTHVLKYISAFLYEDARLAEIFPALKKQTLLRTDVFPFFEPLQSNIAFIKQDNKMLHLMRHLLNSMIDIREYNKTHPDGIAIDHSATTILYQAYEASLKNWYQETYDPVIEKKFRLELMEELLGENGWTPFDVEQHVDSEWVMVDRDEHGWMKPSRSLPYIEVDGINIYRSFNGAEINQKTGEINFFMTPWSKERPVSEKIFSLFDLQEMLEKNIDAAIFSLDPVDPDKSYHPFNAMRFSPSQLCESELLDTMLLTDYVLKFLTTNQEVQGQYPFDQRSVASMIQHLPAYLRKIIDDFHAAQHTGSLHRFWIEAGEIDLALSDEAVRKDDLIRIGLGDLKMVVKKHRMEVDIHGELNDVGNEDEGWPIYVLTPEQMRELEEGSRIINGHAMIFIYAETKLYYWEDNEPLLFHMPKDFRETLIRLYKQPRENDGMVLQNPQNMPLMYRVTKEMARQTGLHHHYSAEFIFAHEFTLHYDEFAQYLPEFGRLKELSKITALIRFLNGMRKSNQESLEALDFILSDSAHPSLLDTDTYKRYEKGYQKVCQNIISIFQEWRGDLSSSVLQKKWREELNRIKAQIGALTFSSYSTEVDEACQHWFEEIKRDNPRYPSSRIWDEVINPKRSDIARQLSQSKQSSCRSQLNQIFSTLSSSLGSSASNRLIDSFMQGNINPLADALISHEKTKAQQQVHKQFPHSSMRDIVLALDASGEIAATRIATEESRRQMRQEKEKKDKIKLGFFKINLGKHEEPVDLNGQCFWVPASVRHEVKKDEKTGHTRYSFFVYGGVSVQPRINVVQGGNGTLGGNRVGGSAISNINAQAALNQKLRALQKAQTVAVRTEQLPDGRIRYYQQERLATKPGPTRGGAHVTEFNPRTNQVRAWGESYNHQGQVIRVHPKSIDGQTVCASHYPPTGAELRQ